MQISKTVLYKQRSAGKVSGAARTHKEAAATGIGRTLGAQHSECTRIMMEACATRLDEATTAMVIADEAHQTELSDDAPARKRRDAIAETMYDNIVDLREMTTAVYGLDAAQALGFEGSTPIDPTSLIRLGRRVMERMGTVALPEPKYAGMSVDLEFWTGKLGAGVTDLAGAIDAITTEEREAEATLLAKYKAIDEYDLMFTSVASLVSGMLTMAGQVELADRVRPSGSRRGRVMDKTLESAPEGEIP